MKTLTSRERLLRVLARQEPDYIPCCFMSFTALRKRCREDLFALAKAEQELGLDPMLFIPSASRLLRTEHPELRGLPVRLAPEVTLKEWREECPNGGDILHKEYHTPAGVLSTSVKLSDDWPHGEHIPFIDDFQVPRMLKPLITERKDLEALHSCLLPPQPAEIAAYQQEVARAEAFVDEHQVMLAGGWGVGKDMLDWLCGMQTGMELMLEAPDFLAEVLEIIHRWNVQRMKVVLAAPIDLYIRRAWYEGCDLVTPRFYREAILPRLKAEVDLAHEYGAKFGYICSSGVEPMLDFFLEAGIDVLIGVDPIQGTHTDMPRLKRKSGSPHDALGRYVRRRDRGTRQRRGNPHRRL